MLAPRRILHRTPVQVASALHESGFVERTDMVCDLGCGDGTILVELCKLTGCRGFGVDLEAERVEAARARAQTQGVEHLVTFAVGNALDVDLAKVGATVLYVFLIRRGLRQVWKMLEALPPDARPRSMCSYLYRVPDVEHSKMLQCRISEAAEYPLFWYDLRLLERLPESDLSPSSDA